MYKLLFRITNRFSGTLTWLVQLLLPIILATPANATELGFAKIEEKKSLEAIQVLDSLSGTVLAHVGSSVPYRTLEIYDERLLAAKDNSTALMFDSIDAFLNNLPDKVVTIPGGKRIDNWYWPNLESSSMIFPQTSFLPYEVPSARLVFPDHPLFPEAVSIQGEHDLTNVKMLNSDDYVTVFDSFDGLPFCKGILENKPFEIQMPEHRSSMMCFRPLPDGCCGGWREAVAGKSCQDNSYLTGMSGKALWLFRPAWSSLVVVRNGVSSSWWFEETLYSTLPMAKDWKQGLNCGLFAADVSHLYFAADDPLTFYRIRTEILEGGGLDDSGPLFSLIGYPQGWPAVMVVFERQLIVLFNNDQYALVIPLPA